MMNVYFTVDTESSMGGALRNDDYRPLSAARSVFCRIGDEAFGIPLLVRIMRDWGCRGTFFVETLATTCWGEEDTRSVLDFLLLNGQDVQLHIHPIYWFYSELQKARSKGLHYEIPGIGDPIGHHTKDVQLDLLGRAIDYFERFAGYRPNAFRAGCFAGSVSMLQCLHELGIRVDSSYNPCYHPHLSFPDVRLEPNLVQKIENVWEIPVTVARTRLPEGHNSLKFADCTALSFTEIRSMLDAAERGGQEHFVIVFHSFSAIKPRDVTYSMMRPNRIVIRRLETMFRYLSENSTRFRVDTMGEFGQRADNIPAVASTRVISDLPVVTSLMRKAVQLINNVYWV